MHLVRWYRPTSLVAARKALTGMQGSKYIAAAGVAGAALMLLRRAMRSNLVTGRNRLKLLTPIPEDIEISQAVKLTPVRARVEPRPFWPASAARVAG